MSAQIFRRAATAAVCLATAAATCTALALPASANPGGTTVVINEVYGGGGNSGAPYTNDFIELYNPTGSALSLDGWSVQYASGSSSSTQGFNGVTALSGSIAAHGYYLVQEYGPAGGAGNALPAADVSGSLNLSASTGAVLLANTTAPVGTQCTVDHSTVSDSGCAAGLSVTVDLVGYGSTEGHYETAPAPGTGNATSDARTNGADTDTNATDFTEGAPTPQDSTSGGPSPLALADPGEQQVYVGASIKGIDLNASGGATPYTWSARGLPAGLTLSQSGRIEGTPTTAGTSAVTVTVTDADDATASTTFTITVATPPTLTVAQIQGTNTETSPYEGDVVTTRGVVTAAYPTGGLGGFYLQTGGSGSTPQHADTTPGASDAIFVYGSESAGRVSIGESVRVTGTVSEFKGTTEIEYPTVTTLATRLKAVTADRIPWTGLQTDAQKEAHEGELMAPQGTFTVSDNYDANWYGSFTLASGKTPLRQPTDAGTAGSTTAQDIVADNARLVITLDDGSSWNYFTTYQNRPLPWLAPDNPVRIGSTVTFHQPVILEFRNDAWTFQPTAQVTGDGTDVATFSNDRPENEQPATVGGDIRLATFNVENYFPMTGERYEAAGLGHCTYYTDRLGARIAVDRCSGTDGSPGPRGAADEASFARQQSKIVTGIDRLGASIVSLEEIENSVKFGEPRDTALAGLVDALNAAAGSDVWAYVPSPSASDLPPAAEQDVIRTAFIYRPADVQPVGPSHVLVDKSGAGQSFSIAREPLAQAFVKAGAPDAYSFLVVANHFKSKGSDADGLFTDCPGGDAENTNPADDQGAFNCTRVHEARDMAAFAAQTAAAAGTDRIFLLGDFNAYTHEDPMQELYSAGYTDLGSEFDPSESTYSYDGLEGSLDHVLANAAALRMVTGADVWQINAQEAVAFAYSRYDYNVTDLFNGNEPFAASDHDPVVAGLILPQPLPAWSASAVYHAGDQVSYHGSTWQALWWTQDQQPGDPYGPWQEMISAPDGTAVWTASRVFNAGDTALYQGTTYVAQWYTRNQKPGTPPYGPWKPVG